MPSKELTTTVEPSKERGATKKTPKQVAAQINRISAKLIDGIDKSGKEQKTIKGEGYFKWGYNRTVNAGDDRGKSVTTIGTKGLKGENDRLETLETRPMMQSDRVSLEVDRSRILNRQKGSTLESHSWDGHDQNDPREDDSRSVTIHAGRKDVSGVASANHGPDQELGLPEIIHESAQVLGKLRSEASAAQEHERVTGQ
jgi:hypothetical protein